MNKRVLFVVIALTAFICLYAYLKLLLPLDVFLWDESHHGFYAMQIFNDLQTGDWGAFWVHTNNQALWMPLHSWLEGFFLYCFGFSYSTARCTSLLLFFLGSIIIFLISLELSEKNGWQIGLLAVITYLTSPALLHLAVLGMQEMLGIFICLITVYFMVKNSWYNTAWKYLAIGLLISIAYWAKQNFAIVMALSVGLFQLSLLWDIKIMMPGRQPENKILAVKKSKTKNKHKQSKKQQTITLKTLLNRFKSSYQSKGLLAWLFNNIFILIGFLPLFVLWWVMPPFERKYALTVTIRQESLAGGGLSFFSSFAQTAFLYIQSLVTSYNLSFWLAIGVLISLAGSFYYFNNKNIRLIMIIFYANFIFLSLLHWSEERFLSLSVPPGFILFGFFSLTVYERYKQQFRSAWFIRLLLLIVVFSFIYDLTRLTGYTKEVANRSITSFIYKESLNQFSPPFLFGLAKRPAFTFPGGALVKDKKYPNFPAAPQSSIKDVLAFFSSSLDRTRSISTMISLTELSPYVIYWHFHDWGAPVMSINDLQFNQSYFWSAEYFLALDIAKTSPYNIDIVDRSWENAEKILLKGGYIKLVKSKKFADLGLTANIYKRQKEILVQSGR